MFQTWGRTSETETQGQKSNHFFQNRLFDFLWKGHKSGNRLIGSYNMTKKPRVTFVFLQVILIGELQRRNKLISSERPFEILQNETKIVKIRQVVLEIFNCKDLDCDSFPRRNDRGGGGGREGTPILGHIRDVRPEWVSFQAKNLRDGVNFWPKTCGWVIILI